MCELEQQKAEEKEGQMSSMLSKDVMMLNVKKIEDELRDIGVATSRIDAHQQGQIEMLTADLHLNHQALRAFKLEKDKLGPEVDALRSINSEQLSEIIALKASQKDLLQSLSETVSKAASEEEEEEECMCMETRKREAHVWLHRQEPGQRQETGKHEAQSVKRQAASGLDVASDVLDVVADVLDVERQAASALDVVADVVADVVSDVKRQAASALDVSGALDVVVADVVADVRVSGELVPESYLPQSWLQTIFSCHPTILKSCQMHGEGGREGGGDGGKGGGGEGGPVTVKEFVLLLRNHVQQQLLHAEALQRKLLLAMVRHQDSRDSRRAFATWAQHSFLRKCMHSGQRVLSSMVLLRMKTATVTTAVAAWRDKVKETRRLTSAACKLGRRQRKFTPFIGLFYPFNRSLFRHR